MQELCLFLCTVGWWREALLRGHGSMVGRGVFELRDIQAWRPREGRFLPRDWSARCMMERGKRCYVDVVKDWESEWGEFLYRGTFKPEAQGRWRVVPRTLETFCDRDPVFWALFCCGGEIIWKISCIMSEA